MNSRTEEYPTVLASEAPFSTGGGEEYWWHGEPGKRGAVVFKTDRFGQRWVLDLDKTHWVTMRVAAGLIDVTTMTIHNWIRDGKIKETKNRRVLGDLRVRGGKISFKKEPSVVVIPLREVERLAEERGVFRPHPRLTPEQRKAIRGVPFNRKKGGDKDADEG